MQKRLVARFDAVRLFIFVLIVWTLQLHFTLWLSVRKLQCKIEDARMPQRIRTSLGLGQGWTQCPTLDAVLYQVLQVSEQWCYESACNPVVLPIGVGAGNYLEVRGVFHRISRNSPEKILGHFFCEYFLVKTGLSDDLQKQGLYVTLGAIFSNQSTLGAISNPISWDFAQIFRDFAKVFTDFTQISTDFQGFCPSFHQIKTFEGALPPSAPQPPSNFIPLNFHLILISLRNRTCK